MKVFHSGTHYNQIVLKHKFLSALLKKKLSSTSFRCMFLNDASVIKIFIQYFRA